MARKKVDPTKLAGLVQQAAGQEISKGTPLSYDPKNFPVFRTPVNKSIIVYIPMTNVVSDETGTRMNVLESHIHQVKQANSFKSLRCINGLHNSPLFDELGYDGTCPACEATAKSWELYNIKLESEAKRLGIDIATDTADSLKSVRTTLLGEREMQGADEFVTFPIVIIPTADRFQPTADALEKLEPVYVHFRKSRYEDKILKALDSMMVNPGHLGGQLMVWDFSYNTGGKEATARDSAKNAKYSVITDAEAKALFGQYIPTAEQVASPFTIVKAAEVVVATEFLYKDDLQEEVNKAIQRTEMLIEMAKGGNSQPALGGGTAPAIGTNPLASFGQADVNTAPQTLGTAPQNLGNAQGQAPVQPAVEQPAQQQFVQPQQPVQPVAEQPVPQQQFVQPQQPVQVEQPAQPAQPVAPTPINFN